MAMRLSVALAALTMMMAPATAEETVLLHAAGSLRAALSDVAKSFEAAGGGKVQAKFGASGLLKDEIAGGAKAEVFASANMEHPQALAAGKRSGPVVLFARNRLCALARPGFELTPAALLDRMLDPQTKLGTSTPKADPSGDYAWEVFRKAETLRAGSSAALEKKALQLAGGPTSPPAPQGRSIYGELIAQGAADIFLTYCTSALAAQRENPAQQIVQLPDALAVGADYGLTVMNDASVAAYQFGMFILSAEGQRTLAKYGFAAPVLPQ
ncbi:molybdate ABC transporter substrate-binding protein [Bradyrhizobium roseum]|uniref:molybdate ABC transporter substrate-binding protein n=1 Tax=Bradyrhizobium roseum TaxID=3056648 RepID=UPI00262772C3|nr:molybdate ABC transporter substrate-binding protein [Bradyrhizobium roseus]WKA28060.1 molybdate ABC transporter substrate-binding protein [Bradyrhizobium roseus]